MTQGTRQEELDFVNSRFPDSPTPAILPADVRAAFAFLIASSWNLAEDGQGSGNMPAPGNQTLVQYVTLPQAQALLPNPDGTGPMNVVPGLLYVISGFAGGQLVVVEGLNSGFFASEGYQLDTSNYTAHKVTVDVRGGAISQPATSPSPTYSFANLGGSPADNAALVQYIAAYVPSITELVYGTPVALNQWVVAANGLWQARRAFTPNALPAAGPNWRLIAAFGGTQASTSPVGTDAGRAILNAPSAGAQRTLLNGLNIAVNQYALSGGTHPAFTQEDGPNGVTAWLLQQVAALNASVQPQPQPNAPTQGVVDDTGDTFSFLPNPAYPSFAQYKVNGLPGVTGAVVLDSQNSYVQGGRIYVKVVGAVAKGGLAVYVAGSGLVPDGKVLTNADPFTASSNATTPDPPAWSFDADTRYLSLAHATLAGSELEYSYQNGAYQQYTATLAVDNNAHPLGDWKGRVKAATGRNPSAAASSPAIAAKGTTTKLATPTGLQVVSGPDGNGKYALQWNPVTYADGYQLRQGGSVLIGTGTTTTYLVSAGSYEVQALGSGNYSPSDFSFPVQAGGATGPLKILVLDHGTSLEQADQATVDKYGSNYPLHTGTNSIQQAQNAVGNTGRASSAEQLQDLWNAENNGVTLTCINLGYPGKDAYYFERNILSLGNSGFSAADYDYIFHLVNYGVNGVEPDQPGDSTDPADLAASVKRICQSLTAQNAAKTKVFVTQPANRTYNDNNGNPTPLYANFDAWRTMYTASLQQNLGAFASGMDNIYEWDLGQAAACFNYPNALIVDGVHWTYLGQGQRAKSKARMLARYLGKTLSFGNGAAPVATPAVTLAITPTSGQANAQRTSSFTTTANYATAELFQVNASGVSYPPVLIGTGASVSFTPPATARYYVRLTLANGSYLYSQLVTATVATSGTVVTKTLDFTTSQVYFTKQSDGSMLKTSGPDDGWRAQATASFYFGPDGIVGSKVIFNAPAVNGQGAGMTIGLSADPALSDGSASSINAMEKCCLYIDDDVARLFYSPNKVVTQVAGPLTRPSAGDQIQLEVQVGNYVFTNLTTGQEIGRVPNGGDPTGFKHYIIIAGSLTNASRIPQVTAKSTQFLPL